MMPEQAPKREVTPAQREAIAKMQERRRENAELRRRGEPVPPPVGHGHGRKPTGRKPGRPPRTRVSEKPPARAAAPVLTAPQRDKVLMGLGLALAGVDTGLATFTPEVWKKEDRLTEEEAGLLKVAVYSAMELYPPLLLALARISVATGPLAYLGICCGAIAAPRLARRGVINDQLAAQLAAAPYIFQLAAVTGIGSGGDPVSVATEPTPSSGGSERNGQVNAYGVAAGYAAQVSGDAQEQGG